MEGIGKISKLNSVYMYLLDDYGIILLVHKLLVVVLDTSYKLIILSCIRIDAIDQKNLETYILKHMHDRMEF